VSAGQPLVGYDELLRALRQLCAERRVGTLYVTTADNKAASFTLLEGEIVGVRFRVYRGREALPHLKAILLSRHAFSEGNVADTDPDLPTTGEILQILGVVAPAPAAPAPARGPAARPAARASRVDLGRVQAVLEGELVEYLGPMAKMICTECIEKTAPIDGPADLRRLIDALAQEIGDPAREEVFKREAWNKLPV
jgi:hypothetical protein